MSKTEANSLKKVFGTLTAVADVSLKVDAGEVVALLGPNGAGKTTTIRMLASILKPTSGRVLIDGMDVIDQAVEVRRRIGLLTEHHGLYTRMHQVDYLEFFSQVYDMKPEPALARIHELLERFGLGQAYDRRLGQFSKGMRQKLALVRTLLHDPPILLLDEPTSAMDPSSAHLVRNSIRALRSSERAIIVCTHNLAEAEQLADRIAIISRGRIIAQGSAEELKHQILGIPLVEVRTVDVLDGELSSLPAEIKVVDQGKDWFRYASSDSPELNHQVLETLLGAGVKITGLNEVPRSLEEVYLRVIELEGGEI
jgi:ABC-2 type transport system ATP-binding protein